MANAVIGAEIRLEGEKDFKRAVSSINTDLKLMGSELKKVESEYKGNENSLSALTAKSEQFNKIAEEQRKKVEILQTAVEKSRAKYTAAGENVEKYRKELSDAQGELDRLKNSEGATTEEVQQQEQAVAELTKKLQTAEKSYSTAEKQTKNWEISLNRAEAELNDTERELGETNKKLREMGESSRFSKEQIEAAERTLSDFGQKAQPIANGFKAAFKTVLAVSAAAAGASAAVIKKSADIGGEFEAQMSKVKAISGATQGEMEQLTAKAKEMGGTTKFTAKEAGEALEYMSMAGWKTADMLSGIGGIMHLAAASGEDLGKTSDIVTDALTAFGMKAKDAGHFADVLAAASSNANTNVGMMGETFKYVGAMAGTLGYSAEDVGLSIGLMANAGIKASQAGTELNAIYTRLSVNTSHARDEIEGLGISFYDSNGKARAWGTILDEMRIKTANMTDAEKTAFANRVAGQRAQAGLLAMLNATSADYDKLTKSINNADGAAQRMADTMQDNLQGQLTVLKSGLEGTAITIYESMQKPLTEGVKTAVSTLNDPRIQDGVKKVGQQFGNILGEGAKLAAKYAPDFIKGFQKITAYLSSSSFKSGVKAGGELLMNTGKVAVEIGKVGFPILAKGTEMLAKSGKVLVPVLAAGYAGFKAFQIVKSVTTLVQGAGAAFQALNVVMMANPWGLAIGGAAALAVALVGIAATCGETANKYAELDREIEETTIKMQDMAKARQDSYNDSYKEIYQVEQLRDRLNELVDKNGKLIGKKKDLQSVVKQLNEKGFSIELNKTGDLVTNYKSLNKEIDEYVKKKEIQAKLDALEPEYQEAIINEDKYHQRSKDSKKAFEDTYEKVRNAFKNKWGVDYNVDEAIKAINRMSDDELKIVGITPDMENLSARKKEWESALKQEQYYLDLHAAILAANKEIEKGNLDEANKILDDYFEKRNASVKRASDYDKNQRKKAITELGEQLTDEIAFYEVALDSGNKNLIEKTIKQIKQAADELKQVGVEIPDSIVQGLEAGTLSVDEAMKQIELILKNGGNVDLTEEGKETAKTLADGLMTGEPDAEKAGERLKDRFLSGAKDKTGDAETAGNRLVDSFLSPLGSPTPQTEAKKDGQATADAYADGVKSKTGAAENAGDSVSNSAVKGLGNSDGDAENAGKKAGTHYSGGVDSQKGKAKQAGKNAGDAAVKGMVSAKAAASTGGQGIGSAFSTGIIAGINAKLAPVKRAAGVLVNNAVEFARKVADVNSPSKKSRDLVGKPLGEGVVVGLEQSYSAAGKKAAELTSNIIEKMRSASASAAAKLSDGGASGGFGRAGAVGGGSSKTINIRYENTFNSAAVRDGDALLRQLDRALGAKL